tara:strand:+ start:330 stop:3050 length:2721 start_codon:yes stop_codon:yes gene_type:complete
MQPQQKKQKRSFVSDTLLDEIQEYFKKYQYKESPQLQLSRNKEVVPTEKVNRWTISLRNGDQHVTIRSNEPDPIRAGVKRSVVFWVDHGGNCTVPQHVLCQLPWTDKVNTLRRKIFQAMVTTNQPTDVIVLFLHSQLVGRVVVQQQETVQYQQAIDFHTVVLDYFGKCPIKESLMTHMLKQKKPKKTMPFIIDENVAYANSCTYWHTGEKRGPLLCETQGTNPLVIQCFAALPDNDDTKARFAISQLVGYPVQSWLDVIDQDDLPLDVSMVPGNEEQTMVYHGGVVEASLFVMVKKMLGIPTLAPEPNPLQIIQNELGMDVARRCFHLGDLSSSTFAQSQIALPKSQAESYHNLEYLFKENLRSTSFYVSLLANFTKGAFELRLAEDIVVDIRLVKHRNISRYICGLVRESPEFNLPSQVPHLSGTLSTKKLASWGFQVMRYFAGDEGTWAQMVDLYKEHAWFCIWDLKATTFEASHVYASDAYVHQFGPQQNIYTVFGEEGYTTTFLWTGVLKPLLQGRTPRLHRDVMREGKMHTYVLRQLRSKSKRFYVLVVEEKQNYNLPLHLEEQRKELGSSILSVTRWGWQVLKWFYRRSSSSMTWQQIQSRYKGIYVTTDLSQSTFETSLHYSDEFMQYFDDVFEISTNIKSTRNPMHVMWNVILRPIWSGRIPEIERDIQCNDGMCRTFTITFHIDSSKQFYTAVLVEKTPEVDATDALVGSAIEEEVPTDFGEYDVREWMHKMLRLIKKYPTDVPNSEQCQQVLEKMLQVHGPESDVQMFLIHDMHVANWSQSLVYRSKKHVEYYGEYTTIMQRVKTNTITLLNLLPRIYQLVNGTCEEDNEVTLLRVNDVEVDTVRMGMIHDPRYMAVIITILSTKRYRPPKMQDWDSSQEDSQEDTEGWSILKLLS